MARKKKAEINEEINRQAFYAVDIELGLSKMDTMKEQVRAIILAADKVQDAICMNADAIKVDAYRIIKGGYQEIGMSPKCWLDTVSMRRLQFNQNLSQEFIEKVKKLRDGAVSDIALRDSILDGMSRGTEAKNIELPTVESPKDIQYDKALAVDDNFIKLLDASAHCREYIDNVLYPKLNQYSQAFEYLTKETHKEFKTILDMWHYRNGGWPSENTPPRIWRVAAGFRFMHDLLDRYGFDMLNDWIARFGIEAKFNNVSPTAFKWGDLYAKAFGKHTMFKIREVVVDKYKAYGCEPYYHYIVLGDKAYGYVWDTRVVKIAVPANVFDLIDITTDYNDDCMPLRFNKEEFNDQAILDFEQEIEDVRNDYGDGETSQSDLVFAEMQDVLSELSYMKDVEE